MSHLRRSHFFKQNKKNERTEKRNAFSRSLYFVGCKTDFGGINPFAEQQKYGIPLSPNSHNSTLNHMLAMLSLSCTRTAAHHIKLTFRAQASSKLSSPESNSSSEMSTKESDPPPQTPPLPPIMSIVFTVVIAYQAALSFGLEAFARLFSFFPPGRSTSEKKKSGYRGFPPGERF